MMEHHDFALRMQKDFIREVESAMPAYIVYVNVSTSWLYRYNSHKLLFRWFEKFRLNYTVIGLVDIFREKTIYSWFPNLSPPPRSKNWLAILKRKNSSPD